MSTIYPNGIDTGGSSGTLPTVYDNITDVVADTVNRLQQAIIAVEQALGINPQGTYTNTGGVRARLDNVDTQITNLNTSVANVVTEVNNILANLTGEQITLGTPSGGFSSGITTLQPTTPITEAVNTFNSIMSYLAPAQAQSMQGLTIDAVTSIPFFTGKIAHNGSSSGYYGPFTAGSSSAFITKTQSFTLTTHSTNDSTTGFSDADKGIITLQINNAGTITSQPSSGFNLGTAFDEGYRTGAQGISYAGNTGNSSAPLKVINSFFQIYSIALFNGFPLWQKGVARITNTSLSPGYNGFTVTQIVGSTLRTSLPFQVFYDSGAVDPSFIAPPSLGVSPSPSHLNYLSGIKFLTALETIVVTAIIANTFVNTYLQVPISYTFTAGIPNSTSDLSDPALSGFTPSAPDVGQSIVIGKVFTISTLNQQSINQVVTVAYQNIYGTLFQATSTSNNVLVNTYNTPASTGTTESFVDEFYRLVPDIVGNTGTASAYPNDYTGLPSVITGQWTSTAILVNGNAQVYNAQLMYPTINFTTGHSPTQQSGTNYSGFNNSNSHSGQVYYRAMYSASNPRSSGTLTINGISLSDITAGSPNVKLEMKLPGGSGTGWLDFSKSFNSGTFSGITGDGCRTGNSGSTFGWSCGSFTTGTSGFMYILRITLFNTTRTITSLSESFTGTF